MTKAMKMEALLGQIEEVGESWTKGVNTTDYDDLCDAMETAIETIQGLLYAIDDDAVTTDGEFYEAKKFADETVLWIEHKFTEMVVLLPSQAELDY